MATSTATKTAPKTEAKEATTPAVEDTKTEAPATAPAESKADSKLKNRLRNEAEREILDKYKDELVRITEAKFDEAGIKYVRRLTQDEKDEKALEALLAKNPGLRSKLAAELAPAPAEAEVNVGE
jgi:hypothetical protein